MSTCYVAGSRRGRAAEELVDASPVLRRGRLAGRGRRPPGACGPTPTPRAATPASLKRFRKAARTELGAAGGPLLAEKTEQLRQRWVDDRLVEAGRARAASLGYPDAYAFTKALAEKALAETKGGVPATHPAPLDHRVGPGRAPPRLDPRASAWPSR